MNKYILTTSIHKMDTSKWIISGRSKSIIRFWMKEMNNNPTRIYVNPNRTAMRVSYANDLYPAYYIFQVTDKDLLKLEHQTIRASFLLNADSPEEAVKNAFDHYSLREDDRNFMKGCVLDNIRNSIFSDSYLIYGMLFRVYVEQLNTNLWHVGINAANFLDEDGYFINPKGVNHDNDSQ